MPLNAMKLLSLAPHVTLQTLTPRDVMLYALGVGADELRFIYEDGLCALPTMPVVMAMAELDWRDPTLGITWEKLLHGEQFLELHAPLPIKGVVKSTQTIEAIFDKGAEKGAVMLIRRTLHDETGTLLATLRMTTFLRADGGFGGNNSGAPAPHAIPDRAPDAALDLPTAANQAQLYRLSGDYNPLHIDPAFAKRGGFERPILHGLCSYGIAGRAVLRMVCDNDPARLRLLNTRFSSPVFPGETIRTQLWHEGAGRAAFRCVVVERNTVVLNNGLVEYR